jgi:trigger factor
MKDYLQHTRTDEATYKEQTVKPEAERRLKAELILRKIREMKKIEPTDAEITAEIDKIINEYQNTEVVTRLREKLIP